MLKICFEIVNKTDWITAQHTPEHCVNSTGPLSQNLRILQYHGQILDINFKNLVEMYLSSLEVNLSGTLYKDLGLGEESPSCPIAEELQMTLLQFKTNYWIWMKHGISGSSQNNCLF